MLIFFSTTITPTHNSGLQLIINEYFISISIIYLKIVIVLVKSFSMIE